VLVSREELDGEGIRSSREQRRAISAGREQRRAVSAGRGWARRGARTTRSTRRSDEAPARSEHGECERRRESERRERELGQWREGESSTGFYREGEGEAPRGEGENGWPRRH
jgi:hypothetical protein